MAILKFAIDVLYSSACRTRAAVLAAVAGCVMLYLLRSSLGTLFFLISTSVKVEHLQYYVVVWQQSFERRMPSVRSGLRTKRLEADGLLSDRP